MIEIRLTRPSLSILNLFLADLRKRHSGAEISKATGVKTGTLYPILVRFEERGWMESEWEKIEPREAGRPRRRFYRLTELGKKMARAALAEFR